MGLHWHVRFAPNTQSYYAKATKWYGEKGKKKSCSVYLHVEILKVDSKSKKYVDHINHNTLDNRKSNLRITKNNENLKHRKGLNKNNTSGYRNITWDRHINKWVVQLQVNGKNKRLGEFVDIHEAVQFRNNKRKELYGEFEGVG